MKNTPSSHHLPDARPSRPADDHDHGLAHDLRRLQQQVQRRGALRWLAGAGAFGLTGFGLAGCGGGGGASDTSTSTTTTTTTTTTTGTTTGTTTTGSATCSVIPEETNGPYPGDGSNSNGSGIANALTLSGIVRSDIRSSIAGATGVAQGVTLTVVLDLVNTGAACADLSGYAIYIWHCDREGRYSMYSSGVTAENYLRGVQATGSDGTATFVTVFPGCYAGRWPHIHFEIYRSTTTATQFSNRLKTSQLALPADVCSTVYDSASGYTASVANFRNISLASDNVFSDGVTLQMASVTGDATTGYTARLQVGIAA